MKKILIFLSNPTNSSQLRLGKEHNEIDDALKQSKKRDEFQVVSKLAVRVKDLRQTLLELEDNERAIVHFSGHGAGSDGLILEDDFGKIKLVSSDALAQLFNQFQQQVECVILNACYSEQQAEAIHQYIDCVIGMNQAIGDVAAINFATAFYEALGAGKNYEKCFEFARVSLNLEGIPESETPKKRYRPRRNNSDIQETKTAENTDNLSSPPVSQTMTFSGGTVRGPVGQAGRDLTQTQNFSSDDQEKQLTITEVRTLIQKIEAIVRSSNLPEKYQEKALNYLESVQEEIQASEPDKSYAAKSLQKANKALKDANIWDKLKPQLEPLLTQLESWLEVEAKTLSNF